MASVPIWTRRRPPYLSPAQVGDRLRASELYLEAAVGRVVAVTRASEPLQRPRIAFQWSRTANPLSATDVTFTDPRRDWKQRRTPWIRRVLLYILLALIPVVILGLLFYVAKHSR